MMAAAVAVETGAHGSDASASGRRRGNVLGAEKLPAGVEIPREQRQPDMRAGVASIDERITHDKLLSPVGQELDLRPCRAAAVARPDVCSRVFLSYRLVQRILLHARTVELLEVI